MKRKIQIDYMYLDLNSCDRCIDTEKNLEEAIAAVSDILKETGVEVKVNKIHVTTEEQALELGFVSSPTIRINGIDIQLNGKETYCKSCSDICGDDVDCRVWTYQGKEYTVIPKGMVIDAILKAVYGGSGHEKEISQNRVTEVPENLKKFFKGNVEQEKEEKSGCCTTKNGCGCDCC